MRPRCFRARWRRGDRGASLAEYALALGATVLVVMGGLNQVEDGLTSELDDRGNSIGQPANDGFTVPTFTSTTVASSTPSSSTTVALGTVSVSQLTGTATWSGNKWAATVEITVRDGAGNTVSGATVTGTWTLHFASTTSCTTDSSGTCSMTQWNINSSRASTTWTVSAITATGFTYDPAGNTVSQVTIDPRA